MLFSKYNKIKKENSKELNGKIFEVKNREEIIFCIGNIPWYYNNETKSFRISSLGFVLGHNDIKLKFINEKGISKEILNNNLFDDEGIEMYGQESYGPVEMDSTMVQMLNTINKL